MPYFFRSFNLHKEIESFEDIINQVRKDAVFKGIDRWILVFAILIASLGLNLNSAPVIIGAMLISPLMGPIIGLGMGVAIYDPDLIRKALYYFFFAVAIGLATSTLFFMISPLHEAHSEILSRISPTIYDVLIAFFGGFAGTIAGLSKGKGNVIVGVAIATALMPPLCTAGYGIATGQLSFFFGAFYLFLINSVFIALSTFITARLLHFRIPRAGTAAGRLRTQVIIWTVVTITLIPSIYFGYEKVQQMRFSQAANQFISSEVNLYNDYLLKTIVDPAKRKIILTYGGEPVEKDRMDTLRARFAKFNFQDASLEIRQGFSFLNEREEQGTGVEYGPSAQEKETEIRAMAYLLDSIESRKRLSRAVEKELKAEYPQIFSSFVQPEWNQEDSLPRKKIWICVLAIESDTADLNENRIKAWLKVRLDADSVDFDISKHTVPSKKPVP